MVQKFVIHAHAENPDQDAMFRIWRLGIGTELRLYLSITDAHDPQPRWAIAHAHKVENWADGVHALACSKLAWADTKEELGAAVFLYRTKETEGIGIQQTRTIFKF